MKKAVLSNRIYVNRTKELHDIFDKELTYQLPPKRPGLPYQYVCDVTRINKNILTIPIGRTDLIPKEYEIVDNRKKIPVNFPNFKFTLREDQQEVFDKVNDSMIIQANPSWGKAQPHYSKIRVPNGWTTMGDIKVGDKVLTPDNKISTVTGKYLHKNKKIYEIEFYDGRIVHACGEHLWKVFLHSSKRWIVTTTEDLLNRLKTKSARIYVPLCSSISDTETDLPLHPYLLGFLIGDGNFTTNSIGISTADDFIIKKISNMLPENHKITYSSNYDYYLVGNGYENKINTALKELKLSGCTSDKKFIPEIYKYSSLHNKLQILQGLFDADGSAEKDAASFEFSTTSKQLMDDVCEMIYSLGGVANIQTRQTTHTYNGEKKKGKISYRVRPSRLSLEIKKQFFSLPRKKDRIRAGAYDNAGKLLIKNIKLLNQQDCSCISIDSNDKLYLTDNYIVTHNTFTCIAIAKKFSQKTLVIVHTKNLFYQWKQEVEKTLGIEPGLIGDKKFNIDSPITIGLVQSLRNKMAILTGSFGTVIVDECHHVPATVFKGIVDAFKARYKFGTTATPWRKDGQHLLLWNYFGGEAAHIIAKDNNKIDPTILMIDSDIELSSNPMIPWATRINQLYDNPRYMELVLNLSEIHADEGHLVLTLADRVEFLEQCHDLMEDRSMLVVGNTEDRDFLGSGKEILFGTSKIYAEGVNIPPLSCLIMAMVINNRGLLEQLLGRINRIYEGKKDPIAVDIMLRGKTAKAQAIQRMNFYAENNLKMITV